ncbi:hypothetical protein Q8A73_014791 [Channa argus]|nr:hypothetical protein Q8A73_014791 [Channa argus]
MEDYEVDMDEEEDEEVFTRKANAAHWWENCGDDGNCDIQHEIRERCCMVNSRSWAEELEDNFAPQAEDSGQCYSVGQTRLSSISSTVDCDTALCELCLCFSKHVWARARCVSFLSFTAHHT